MDFEYPAFLQYIMMETMTYIPQYSGISSNERTDRLITDLLSIARQDHPFDEPAKHIPSLVEASVIGEAAGQISLARHVLVSLGVEWRQ